MNGYHYLSLTKKANRGFTLIEMAVVMVIIGIIISIVTSVLPSLVRTAKTKQAQATLEKVDFALLGYSIANHRLPFADSDGDGRQDSVCTGDLPYLTLGLSSAKDPWRNSIKYAVHEELTATTSSTFCTTLAGILTYDDPDKIHITDQDTGQITNQAYVIVSGGAKDLDNDQADSFFDGHNEGNDLQFDDPVRIEFHGSPDSNRYDDLMRALSFNELYLKNCGGSGGAGDAGGTLEICDNAIDDDGDGDVDCDDMDCADDPVCAGAGDPVITTSIIPSGPVNSDYSSVTFQAAGGTTPYEWTLISNGGFTDFSLNTYTGHLSGTLDQCPETYSISVQVEDSTLIADGGPKTDSKNFSLLVTCDLSISRTSGPGTDITWNSPDQEETFKVYGGHLGDIEWQLNTDGATGFVLSSQESDTCLIKKNGATTAGTYTFTLTATDAACIGNTAEINLNVTVTSSGAGSPMKSVSEWHLDENSGTTAIDSEDGNDGTINGASWTTGVSGSALDFDGTGDYVDCGNNPNLPENTPFTVSAWAKANRLDQGWVVITDKFASNAYVTLSMYLTNDNTLSFTTGDGVWTDLKTEPISANRWYNVVAVWDGETKYIYLNGALANSEIPPSSGRPCTGAGSFSIGGRVDGTVCFDGVIDEVSVYDKAIAPEELLTKYNELKPALTPISSWHFDENSGTTAADSEDSNHGTIHGASWTTGVSGSALDFDGSSSHIEISDNNNLDITQEITIEAWVRPDTLCDAFWHEIVSKRGIDQIANYDLRFSKDSGLLQFYWTNPNTDPYGHWQVYSTDNTYANGAWHHIVATKSGTALPKLYVDGVLQAGSCTYSATGCGCECAMIADSNRVYIGSGIDSDSNPAYFFNGKMDEVAIYNVALTADEVLVRYNESKPQN